MSFGGNEVNLTLHIQSASDDFDADELNRLTHSLMRSLEDVGVETVTVMRDQDLPLGAKGDPFTLGVLLVTILSTALPKVVEFLQAWTLRNENQKVQVKVSRKSPSGEERTAELEYSAHMSSDELEKQVQVIKHLVE